ncbi:hypothetical protein TrRE_jg763 [Triparma retinervis]|uniref:Uncharacterized protein n=1 Tax=Triparma retinervis TaxID=2557542 RepID=A0A9W7DYF2_9STRA|nr:hypothetical protein TrRE_jg763 [Triparma retinervis]
MSSPSDKDEAQGSSRKRGPSMWQKLKTRVKEKGWVKRWDPNYETNYFENTVEGRVTWTDHSQDIGDDLQDANNASSATDLTTQASRGTLGGELSGIQKSSSNASIGSNVSFGSSTGDNAPSSFALRNKEKKKKKKKAGFVSSDNSSSFGSNVSGTERGTDASEVSFRQSVDISGHQKQASPNMKTAKGRKGTMATIQSGQLLELQKQQAKNSDRMSRMSSNSFDSDSGDQDRGGGGHQRTTTIVNKSDRSITLGLDERITTTLGDEMGDFTTNPMAEARNNRTFTVANHLEDHIVDGLSTVKYGTENVWSNAKKSKIYTLRLIFALISMCVGIVLCLQFTTEVDPLGLNGSGGTGGGDDGRGGVGEGDGIDGNGGNDNIDHELELVLDTLPCPMDKVFIRTILKDEQVYLTPDLTLSSVRATLDELFGIPVLSIESGIISSLHSKTEIDVIPSKFTPVLDSTLCGLRSYMIGGPLRENIDFNRLDLSPFPVKFENGVGVLKYWTSKKESAAMLKTPSAATSAASMFIKDITVKHNSLVATYVVGVPPFGTAPEHYGWGTASKATLEISGEALFVNRTATRFIHHNGEGEFCEEWPVFGRNTTQQPFFKAIVNVTLQTTQSVPYEIGSLEPDSLVYNDRGYTWAKPMPKFMQNMTSVRPSNEDAHWPGIFNKYSDDNLFCIMTKKSTPAIYVLVDANLLIVPYWISKGYERIEHVELLASSNSWDVDLDRYFVYWRRTDGYKHHCFGLNGAEADNMYTVAFGAEPPPSVLTFGEEEEDKWQWTLRDGRIKIDYVNTTCVKRHGNGYDDTDANAKFRQPDPGSPTGWKNCTSVFWPKIDRIWVSGIFGLKVGLTESRIPIDFFAYGDLRAFRFTAHNVMVTSFKSTLAEVAPPEDTGGEPPPFADSASEDRVAVRTRSMRGSSTPGRGDPPTSAPGRGGDTWVATTVAPTPCPRGRDCGGNGIIDFFPGRGEEDDDGDADWVPGMDPEDDDGSDDDRGGDTWVPTTVAPTSTLALTDDEVESLFLANFTFSTFPEDMGLTFAMRAVMSMTNQLGPLMTGVYFNIETHIPFDWNETTAKFLPGNFSRFEFKLDGHVDEVVTSSNHVLRDANLFVHVKDQFLTCNFDSDMHLNFTDKTIMSLHTFFKVPKFSLKNPNATTLSTFSGYLIDPYTPKRADWMTFNQGGLTGSVNLGQTTFIIETLRIWATPEFAIGGVDGHGELNYRRPDYYSIDLMLHVESQYKVKEIADRSLTVKNDTLSYITEVENKTVDTRVKLHLATQGEYFRIEARVRSELSPSSFMGAENTEVEMKFAARELYRGSNESAYMFSLGAKVDKLDFTDSYSMRDVQWLAVAKLSDLEPNPRFNFSASGKSIFDFNSNSTSPLKVNSSYVGYYDPYRNFTSVDATLDLAEIWMVTPQVALTKGKVHVYAEHENGNWTFDPVAYNANGQMQLTDEVDTNVILAEVTGMFDPHGGDSYFILGATLGPLDGDVNLIMPKSNSTLASANETTLVEARFDMCVASKRIARQKRDPKAPPEIEVRPTDDGRGLAVVVPEERPRPPPRLPTRPTPDPPRRGDESFEIFVPDEGGRGRMLQERLEWRDRPHKTHRRNWEHPRDRFHDYTHFLEAPLSTGVGRVLRILRGESTERGRGEDEGFATFNLPGEEDHAGGASLIPLVPDKRPEPTPIVPDRGGERGREDSGTARPGTTPSRGGSDAVSTRHEAIPSRFDKNVTGHANNIDCIDGTVVKAAAIARPALLKRLNVFGDSAGTAEVGIEILGVFPTDGNRTIAVNVTFLGEGLMLAPSVFLNRVFVVGEDFNTKVLYVFELECFGEGQSTALTVTTRLTDSLWITPNIEIHPSCFIKVSLEARTGTGKNKNMTDWEAGNALWRQCAGSVYVNNTSSEIWAMTSGDVDGLTGDYKFSIAANFSNIVEAVSSILNLDEAETKHLMPDGLNNVTIKNETDPERLEVSTQSKIEVDSKKDSIKFRVRVDIEFVWELVSILDMLNIKPSEVDIICEIESSLSNPRWNNTDIRFMLAAKNFYIGPILVEEFELLVDRASNSDLKVTTSSIFRMFDQRWKALGQTNFTKAQTSLRVTAYLMRDIYNPWQILFPQPSNYSIVNVTGALAYIDMRRNETQPDSNFTVVQARMDGEADVRYSENVLISHYIKTTFTEDLDYYYAVVGGIQTYRIDDFLPNFPALNFTVDATSQVELTYNSKTNIATAGLEGTLKSDAVFEPVIPLLPNLKNASLDTSWKLLLATDLNSTWSFDGEFRLNNTKLGNKFVIEDGMLKVHMESNKNASWAFEINTCMIITDSFLAGANETIKLKLGGKYDTDSKLLQLTGRSVLPFHPLGQEVLQMERGRALCVISAPELIITRFETIGYFTSTFTYGEMAAEYVALNDGQQSFVRASNISIHNLETVFDGLYNESANPDAVAQLNPVFHMHLDDVDITFSNFADSGRYQVLRGFNLKATGRIDENSSLVSTMSSLEPEATTVEKDEECGTECDMRVKFKLRFSVDYTADKEKKEDTYPTLYLWIEGKNLDVFPGVQILGFEFYCRGLMIPNAERDMEFQIQLGTTISVQLPNLEAPIITTVEGDFDLEVVNGTVSIDDDWTANAKSKLSQSFYWNPMGIDLYLANPEIHIYFSDNEETEEEGDIEVDKLALMTKNFTVQERMSLWGPIFTVYDFSPQKFGLDARMQLKFYENHSHPLLTDISGVYSEGSLDQRYSQANFSSVSVKEFWPFNNNLITVDPLAKLDFKMKLEDGVTEYMSMEGIFDITFDPRGTAKGETMRAYFKGTSSRDMDQFCWMLYDIPVFTIQRVMMDIFIGENGTEAADNFLLAEDGKHGIMLDVDKRLVNNKTGEVEWKDLNYTHIDGRGGTHENYTTTLSIGSYSQECNMYRDPEDKMSGSRVRLKIMAGPESNLVQVWRLLDNKVHEMYLDLELVMPDTRSARHPTELTLMVNTDYYAMPGTKTSCEEVAVEGSEYKDTVCTTRAEPKRDAYGYTTETNKISDQITVCTTKGGAVKGRNPGEAGKTTCTNKPDGGVSTGSAKLSMQMIDPDSLTLHMILVECDFRVDLFDGSTLAFEVSGKAQEIEGSAGTIAGSNASKYTIDLHGATREPWVHPFGLDFMTVNAATMDVSTTSDLNWNDTRIFMYLHTTFHYNATLSVKVSAEVADGGNEVVLVARLQGANVFFNYLLGSATGTKDEINSTQAGKYLEEAQTSSDIWFSLSTVEKRQYESGFDILGKGIRKGITFKMNLLNYNRTLDDAVSPEDSQMLNTMIGAFVGARSELDIEFWVGIFDNYKSIPPMEISVRNDGANIVFADGLVTIVDWLVGAKFNSARSAWPWLFAKTTIIFRPSDRDEILLIAEGSPLKIAAYMYGIWYEPFGLDWLAVANMGVDFNFVQNTTDWFVVDSCKFRGTGIIGFTFSGRLAAAFVRDAEGGYTNLMYIRVQFFYEINKPPSLAVNEILGKDEVGEGGRRYLEEVRNLGEDTCGSGALVPRIDLNHGDTGKNVTFMQQLLEDVGFVDLGSEEYFAGRFDDATQEAVIEFKKQKMGMDADSWTGGAVNYEVWKVLCKESEEATGVTPGGEREWLSEFRMPGWLKNTLWDFTYSTFDKYDGDMSFRKGVQMVVNINVREMGALDKGLSMLNYVNDYAEVAGYSPLFQAGIHVPILDANPYAVTAWIEANQFSIYEGVLWCNTVRIEVYNGKPPELEVHGQVVLTLENNPRIWIDVWVRIKGTEEATLEGRVRTRWENAFGIDGLVLLEAGVSIGITSGKPDLGSMALHIGLAAKLEIGPVIVFLTGRCGITDAGLPSKDALLYGGLRGTGNDGFGLVFSVRDLAIWYVDDILEEEDGKIWQFDPRDIPATWGLYDTFFQLSSGEIEMFGKKYDPGFAFSTGLEIFGIDCSIVFAIIWDSDLQKFDFKFEVEEGLEAAEEMSRRKLLEEILPDGLVDPSMLSESDRKIKEKDSGLSFDKPFFEMDGIEFKNLNFLTLATGGRPILRLKFKFYGVKQHLDIETMNLKELAEFDLWEKLDAFYDFWDTIFSLPDCMWDSHCYNPDNFYCDAICDKQSAVYYGDCPDDSGSCYVGDKDCLACFGDCWLFQCWYDAY